MIPKASCPRLLIAILALISVLVGCASAQGSPPQTGSNPVPSEKPSIGRLRAAYKAEREYDAELEAKNYPQGFVKRLHAGVDECSLYVVMNGSEGLWATHDGGASWQHSFAFRERKSASGRAHIGKSVFDIAEDRDRKLLYIATDDGVFQSRDQGQSWVRFSDGLPYEDHDFLTPTILRLSLDPASGDVYGEVSLDGFGIYKTGCDKAGWKPIGAGLPESSITGEVCYGPADKSVYVVQGRAGAIMISGFKASSTGIYRGTPKGAGYRWAHEDLPLEKSDFDPVGALRADPISGDLYACTFAGLYRKSKDAWKLTLECPFVRAVAFENGGSLRAVAFAAAGCYLRSGVAWQPLVTPWDPRAIVSSACFVNGSLFVGTNEGLFVSRDSGASWSRLKAPTVD